MRIILLALAFIFSVGTAQAGSITLYKGEAFQGESWNINHAVRNFSDNNGWNDTVMSAIVHDGIWEACVDANYQNCTILQGSDMRDFHRIGLDRKISSIREVDARNYQYGNESGFHRSGFSDEYNYSGGRMSGGQSVYGRDPVLGRRDRERFDDEYEDHEAREHGYRHNGGYANQQIIWNTPQDGRGFLSSCQAEVQDAINDRTGQQCEMTFSGSPNRGQAFDRSGRRFIYSCNGNQIHIW
ncbi:MAG: beta/gamma crystallin family protein [Alphaproteobacteria bacterium]|nr:beta/gamma crystallin family protein [Alphaproteobacteria bacterium]